MSGILYDKILGSIYGGAVGDAMGAPLEGCPTDLAMEFFGGRVTEFQPRIDRQAHALIEGTQGQYTDDTRLKNLLCQAIIKRGGRVTAADFAEVWRSSMDPSKFWLSEKIAYHKLQYRRGVVRDSGAGNIPACDADMMISPIGLINAGNPRQAGLDGYEVSLVCQSSVSASSAGAIAAAVAQAMVPGATVQDVAAAAMENTDVVTAEAVRKSVEMAGKAGGDPAVFKKKFYESMLIVPVDPIEVTSAAVGVFAVTGGDLRRGIIEGANFGRDCDSIAGIVGSIAGAFEGPAKLKPEWIETVRKANPEPDLKELADGLCKALKSEIARQRSYVEIIDRLLG